MRVTEEKLFDLLPDKEKQKALRLKTQASPLEIIEAESGLNAWQQSIQTTDKYLNKNNISKTIPPVRGSADENSSEATLNASRDKAPYNGTDDFTNRKNRIAGAVY